MKCLHFLFSVVAASCLTASAMAAPIAFNFEELAVQSSATITSTQGGITMTITRNDGGNLEIMNLSSSANASFGNRTLGNFIPPYNSILRINFSQAIVDAALSFGDYNQDDDSPVTLQAFSGLNGTGSLIDTDTTNFFGNNSIELGQSGPLVLSVAGTGITSLILTSGGQFPGTLFVDNVVVNVASEVPEPASLLTFGIAGLAAATVGWRRRRTVKA